MIPSRRPKDAHDILAEVHPFDDGNGRIARAMMNAELSAVDQQRIMVTTSMRDAHLGALRALSHNRNPAALIRVLDEAQRLGGEGDWSTLDAATRTVEETGALVDPHAGPGTPA